MLIAYVKKYPCIDNIPGQYCLGKGHMSFFKDKALYLFQRHESLKKEMQSRGFKASKTINLKELKKHHLNDWRPKEKDIKIIQQRIIHKLNLKPDYYRYKGEYKGKKFFVGLIKNAKL
jgi:deoxyribonuclease (pyrimidine dimer)